MAAFKDVAAGFILFRRLQKNIEYLLLQTSYGQNHWTPPKGHLENDESDMDAALRETEEEAGIIKDQLNIINYQDELHYPVKGVMKRVVYFVAEVKDPQVKVQLSDEHINYEWLSLEKTNTKCPDYKDMQALMAKVHNFISELS